MVSRDSGFGAWGSARTVRDWGWKKKDWNPRTWGWALALLLPILAQGEVGLVGQTPAESLTIKVRVHDHARLGPRPLNHAQGEVTRLFLEMGILVHWIECPLAAAELDRYPACQQPLGLTGLDVNIVTRSMAEGLALSSTTLGLTSMRQEGERASVTAVFCDSVREQAHPGGDGFGQILGHAIAHELGHLLLRTSGHAPTGLMRARWSSEDLRRAAWGQLGFTSEQVTVIRAEVAARAQLTAQRQPGSDNLTARVK